MPEAEKDAGIPGSEQRDLPGVPGGRLLCGLSGSLPGAGPELSTGAGRGIGRGGRLAGAYPGDLRCQARGLDLVPHTEEVWSDAGKVVVEWEGPRPWQELG